jgi:hypothetical protein
VVDYGEPAAYSLPGTHQPIVLTTGAIEALDDAQLTALHQHGLFGNPFGGESSN